MILSKKNAAALLLFFVLFACRRSKGHGDNIAGNYADSIKQVLSRIDSTTHDPVIKIQQLRRLWSAIPPEERTPVCHELFGKMFFAAYAHPDSSVLDFFKQQAEGNEQYPRVRIDALFKETAYYLYIDQQPDSGIQVLARAKNYLPASNDTLLRSYYTLYAQAMLQKGTLKEAASYYLKTIAIDEKLNDSADAVGNYGNLAIVYAQMNEDEKAIPIQKKSISYFTGLHDNASLFIGYVGVARSYANLKKMDSAFYYYGKAEELLKAGVHNPSVEVILYTNLGEIYADKGDLKKAIYYYDLCKAPLKEINSQAQDMNYAIYSILAYARVRDVNKEIAGVKNDAEIFMQQKDLVNARAAMYNLYQVYAIKKQPANALAYYIRYDSIDNELAGEANNKYIAELQTKYETQKKEARILQQQREIEKKAAFNKMLLLLLVALAAGTAFIITRSRLRRKKKEAELQQQFTSQLLARGEEERGRIARDLHDGLSQSLLVLKNQLSSGNRILPERIDHVINEVRTISKNIHPVMLEQIGLKESILHICNQVSEAEQLFISADIVYDGQLGKEKELQLFRIIQEALNNVVKYASAQAAKVQLYEENGYLFASVQDNGKGFDVAHVLQGRSAFGLLSIIERSKAMNGKALVISDTSGTVIKIEIPLANG